jgi:hypothetical protein
MRRGCFRCATILRLFFKRFLLTARDRATSDRMPLSHEFLAMMPHFFCCIATMPEGVLVADGSTASGRPSMHSTAPFSSHRWRLAGIPISCSIPEPGVTLIFPKTTLMGYLNWLLGLWEIPCFAAREFPS